jgi:hypothetical protein
MEMWTGFVVLVGSFSMTMIKFWGFLEWLIDFRLLKKDPAL